MPEDSGGNTGRPRSSATERTTAGLRLGTRFRRALEGLGAEYHDLVVLRGSPRQGPPGPGRRLDSHTRFRPEVTSLYEAFGRDMPEWRLRARFEHGLELFVLREGSLPIALTWAVRNGEQFVDEVGVGLNAGARELVLRDAYVHPAHRGRRLFQGLVSAVLHASGPTETVWSVVQKHNRPSMAAHGRCGLRPVERFLVLHLWRRIMIRILWPRTLEFGTAFKPGHRIVLTGSAFEKLVRDHLA